MRNACKVRLFIGLGIVLASHGAGLRPALPLTVPFTEDFLSSSAWWLNASETSFLDWVASGGVDGSSYASTAFNFANSAADDALAAFKGEDLTLTLGVAASDGALAGDWIAGGVRGLSAWVRHELDQPVQYFVRLAPAPQNFPGAFAFGPFVPPHQWTEIRFSIKPSALLFFEGGSFDSVMNRIGNVQIGLFVPAEVAGLDRTFRLDLDKVSLSIPEPASAALFMIGLAACGFISRPRGWQRLRSTAKRFTMLLCLTVVFRGAGVHGEVVTWDEPQLDRWFHQGDVTPGVKPDPSLFTAFGFPGTDHPGVGQVRSGSLLVGFDTASSVPLVEAERYQIHSLRLTLTITPDQTISYDPTADLLADIAGQTDDPGRPIELYGVGYANEYQRLGFGPNDALAPEFEENSPLHSNEAQISQRTFNTFPLGDDGTGTATLGNVFNSPGGEGVYEFNAATEEWDLLQVTRAPWDTVPWTTGRIDGLVPGANVPANSDFVFDVDLSLPGVERYFQHGLAQGQVAVFFSSLHDVSGFHSGGFPAPFPKFYAREHLAVQLGFQSAATLEADYTLLPEWLSGDVDCDGDIDFDDIDDFVLGLNDAANYEQTHGVPFVLRGDMDHDGDADFDDIAGFVALLGAGDAGATSHSVPEPSLLTLSAAGAISVIFAARLTTAG